MTIQLNSYERINSKIIDKSFLKNLFIYLIYLFLAALGLRCCAQAFSSCGTQAFSSCGRRGLLFAAVHGLLNVVASLVAEHGL